MTSGFLTTRVWTIQENSPALVGTAQTMILEDAATKTNRPEEGEVEDRWSPFSTGAWLPPESQ